MPQNIKLQLAMKTTTPFSRLPQRTLKILPLIRERVRSFDRLTLRIDNASPDLPLKRILQSCKRISLASCKATTYHPVWQSELQIFQPRVDALKILSEAIGTRYRSELVYAELACDLIADSVTDAAHLQQYILQHLLVPSFGRKVAFDHETVYFNSRASSQGVRNAHSIVIYADKPSKLGSASKTKMDCCHIEYRLAPSKLATLAGLYCIHDCVDFDHQAFWTEHLRLFSFQKSDLGSLLGDPSSSGTARRNRATTFLQDASHNGAPVLQNCLEELPSMRTILRPIDNRCIVYGLMDG